MNPHIRQKIYDYSETPPASAWEGIAALVEQKPAYAQTLYQFKATPPANAWAKISAGLNTAETKVVPLRTKLFKYAIAAAVLGAIAAGSIFYLKNDAAPALATQQQNASADEANKNSTSNPLLNQAASAAQDETIGNNAGLSNDDGAAGRAFIAHSPQMHIAKKTAAPKEFIINAKVRTLVDTETADRYMIATTATGKAVRLPKKCYSDYACADVYSNAYCKERLSDIQSKMAASVATDFTQFMDLLKKLQEGP